MGSFERQLLKGSIIIGFVIGGFSQWGWSQQGSPQIGTINQTSLIQQAGGIPAFQGTMSPQFSCSTPPVPNAALCSVTRPLANTGDPISQLLAGGQNGAPNLSNLGAAVTDTATNIMGNIQNGGRPTSGLSLACPLAGADGTCPEPGQMPNLPECRDLTSGGGFSQSRFDEYMRRMTAVRCALECHAALAQNARDQAQCMKTQFEAVQFQMNCYERAVEDNLKNQQEYINALDREANRQEQIQNALVGPNGNGGKFGDLTNAQSALQSLTTSGRVQIQRVLQDITNLNQDNQVYNQSIQRAVVERTSRCFNNEIPQGMSVGQCDNGGAPARSVKEFVLCRYRKQLEGSTNPGSVRRTDAQRKVQLLSDLIDQRLGSGSPFSGDGSMTDPGPSSGRGVESNGRAFGATVTQMNGELESVLSQAGVDANAGQWLRSLSQRCADQAQRTVNQEVAAAGSSVSQWKRRLDNTANQILTGTGGGGTNTDSGGSGQAVNSGVLGMINGYERAIRDSYMTIFGQELGAGFRPSSCTTLMSTSNAGSVTFASAGLTNVGNCLQGMDATVNCMLSEGSCGDKGPSMTGINVPGLSSPVACRSIRDCMIAVQREGGAARSQKDAIRGDNTFSNPSCQGGTCPGKNKFLRESSQALFQAIRNEARTNFNSHAAGLGLQMQILNQRLGNLHLDQVPATPVSRQNAQWNCPNSSGQAASGAAAYQICEKPSDMAALFSSLTQPPMPQDPSTNLSAAITRINSQVGDLTQRLSESRDRISQMEGKKNECRSAEAGRQISRRQRQMNSMLEQCQGNPSESDRVRICSEARVNRLEGDLRDIAARAELDEQGSQAIADYTTSRDRLNSLCNTPRTVGQYRDGTYGCAQTNEDNRREADDRRICGENGRSRTQSAAGALDRPNEGGPSRPNEPEWSADEHVVSRGSGSNSRQCIVPGACPAGTELNPDNGHCVRRCLNTPETPVYDQACDTCRSRNAPNNSGARWIGQVSTGGQGCMWACGAGTDYTALGTRTSCEQPTGAAAPSTGDGSGNGSGGGGSGGSGSAPNCEAVCRNHGGVDTSGTSQFSFQDGSGAACRCVGDPLLQGGHGGGSGNANSPPPEASPPASGSRSGGGSGLGRAGSASPRSH